MKIAWIGTGVMGRPMALNLKEGGYDVHVYNRTSSKAFAMEEFGVTAHETLESCVKNADFVFTIVGYPKDVQNVFEEAFKHSKKGAVIVDMTTSSPALAKDLFEQGSKLGFNVIDAPVTGSDLGAINGTLSIMVGGEEDAFNKALPLFQKLGQTINYMGKAGSGQYTKLANQAAIAGAIAGITEALSFAKEKELDLNKVLNVLTGGSANSWQAANNGLKMINNDYKPGFYIKHFLKDLNLILEEAKTFSPEVVKTVQRVYDKLNNNGYGDLGTQALIKYYI